VSGGSHHVASFSTVMVPQKDEPLLKFVQRCALWGVSQLAPYSTTLYLLQQHAADGNFTDVVALTEHAKALLPPTPHSFDRSLFENVLGLVALFKNDKQGARDAFERAMHADPTNPVPFLNASFTDLQFDEYQRAADRMAQLVRPGATTEQGIAFYRVFHLGCCLMGLKDFKNADQKLAQAAQINRRVPVRCICGRKKRPSLAIRLAANGWRRHRWPTRRRSKTTQKWRRCIFTCRGATTSRSPAVSFPIPRWFLSTDRYGRADQRITLHCVCPHSHG